MYDVRAVFNETDIKKIKAALSNPSSQSTAGLVNDTGLPIVETRRLAKEDDSDVSDPTSEPPAENVTAVEVEDMAAEMPAESLPPVMLFRVSTEACVCGCVSANK
eukprot:Gregarina_sp_Poly_1__64@NODE_1012_length_5366_cov_118_438762_g159_i2_p6_GENE_NODE_1012_length_5366_cov_118_438762_g159_i2NODE_1012_length_5366_cov_118_438762_g159_i2_p6_ORF_typecomplete_len105_score14_46_NODE_1012_length_5366_cov_118_438762_g159_i235683882